MQFTLLLSAASPAVLAVLWIALAHRQKSPRWLGLLAPTGALAAQIPVKGIPQLPPADASEWALWGASAAALIGLGLERRTVLRWSVWGGMAASILVLTWLPRIRYFWEAPAALAHLLGGTAALALAGVGWARHARAHGGPAGAVAMTGICAGVGAVLGLSGTALLAQTAVGAATSLAVWVVYLGVWRSRDQDGLTMAAGPSLILAAGLSAGGWAYAEMSGPTLAWLVAALCIPPWIPWPAFTRGGWRLATALGVTTGLFLSGAVTSEAWWDRDTTPPPTEQESYDGYGDGTEDDTEYGY